jgi:hypothetical protein
LDRDSHSTRVACSSPIRGAFLRALLRDFTFDHLTSLSSE